MWRRAFEHILGLANHTGVLKAAFGGRLRCSESHVVVLMYHDVQRESFRKHMDFLFHNFSFLSIEEVVDIIRTGSYPSHPCVAITFDDGLSSFYHDAYPILRELGIPAICYVPSALVDAEMWYSRKTDLRVIRNKRGRHPVGSRQSVIPENRRQALRMGYEISVGMTLDQLREVGECSMMTLGAHSVHHSDLTMLPLEACRAEIEGSKEELEDLLELPVDHFAYPLGRFTAREAAIVKLAGFKSGVGTQDTWISRLSDIYRIPRKGAGPPGCSTDWLIFRLAVGTGVSL